MRVFLFAGATTVTPVQKVIQLLDGMVAKGKAEKQDEQVQFAAYKQWCDDTSIEKKGNIADANEQMEILAADAEKYEADAERLDHDLAHIAEETKAAIKARGMEHADFLEEQADHSQSVQQIGLAINTMKSEAHDVAQTAALMQVLKIPAVGEKSKKMTQSHLTREPEEADAESLAVAAPEANAFEFQSQGIIDLFKKLQDKFEAKLADTQSDEPESNM